MDLQPNSNGFLDKFDRNWESYLTGKPYDCSEYVFYDQYRTWFFRYKPTKSEKEKVAKALADTKERVDKTASFCNERGITVERKTEVEHWGNMQLKIGRRTIHYRRETVKEICRFTLPADQSRSLLHSICDQAYQEMISGLTAASPKALEKRLSEEEKDIAKKAVSMVLDDIKQLRKGQPDAREYSIPILVTAFDFRYKEPSGDVVGIVFEKEGLSPILDKKERDLLCAVILKGLHSKLQKYNSVFDTYVGPSNELDGIGAKASMLVMFDKPL